MLLKKTFHFDFSLTLLRGNWDRAFSYPTSPLFLGVAQTIVGCRYMCWGRGIMWSLFNLLYHLILWLNNQNLRHQDHIHIHFQDKGGPRRGICMFPVCISNNMVVCKFWGVDLAPAVQKVDNTIHQAPVVQTLDSAIHRINHYPVPITIIWGKLIALSIE